MNEQFRTVAEVAEMLGVSRDTVRRMFADEPGVIDLGRRNNTKGKRRYRVLRSVWPPCSAIHSIRLVNPINHSNHSTPSTINMFLFYLLVHDRTEWQDWTIG